MQTLYFKKSVFVLQAWAQNARKTTGHFSRYFHGDCRKNFPSLVQAWLSVLRANPDRTLQRTQGQVMATF